jgi:NAD(P)-dependent dehydrogenase (short-subunit alcohol dehydrogenase family)
MNVDGKCFLVTGGGSGLGEATARQFVERGAAVVIADIDENNGTRVASDLGDRAWFTPTDVTDEMSVGAAVTAAVERFGGLFGAVSCAGIGPPAKVLGKDGPHALDLFERVVRVNLIGTFNVLRLAAAAMLDREAGEGGERGLIVNTASIAAFEGQIGQAAYSASKGGIVGMTLPCARELARHGIRVVTIAPGIFDTPLLAGLPEAARLSLGEQVPFPSRLGRAEEFAALVVHVAENSMLNGEVIRLDGALRMAPR